MLIAIKYKFWDLDAKRMITSFDGITQNNYGKSLNNNIRPLITINGDYCLPHWGKNCIAIQFTGLIDKDNVEIYADDLRITDAGQIFRVYQVPGGFIFKGSHWMGDIKDLIPADELIYQSLANKQNAQWLCGSTTAYGNIYQTNKINIQHD